MTQFDLSHQSARECNAALHKVEAVSETDFDVLNPAGRHSLAVGLDADINVNIRGHVGYYCAGMNKQARVCVQGSAGVGVAENMMSGRVHIQGDASQSAGATAHGGLLIIDGNASARCGISLKGADIVVKGSVGPMSAFMAQAGRLVVLGDAGEALGDSIYEAELFVQGDVASLGADCEEKPMTEAARESLLDVLRSADLLDAVDMSAFTRFGSARSLYNFKVDNAGAY